MAGEPAKRSVPAVGMKQDFLPLRAKLKTTAIYAEGDMTMVKSLRINKSFDCLALTIIIGQLTWPLTCLPVLLGPAFLLGLTPLLPSSRGQYVTAMLITALIGAATGGHLLAAIIVLQFLTWHLAHKQQDGRLWVVCILCPLGVLLWQQPEKTPAILLLTLCSATVQVLLYRTLSLIAQHKIRQLQQEHYHRQGADRLIAASTYSQQLSQLRPIVGALHISMEQTYNVYQDLELLARSDPYLPEALVQRLLAAAQEIHQNRLQLQNWVNLQERTLQQLVGREAASLQTICKWIATQIADIAGKSGQQLETFIDLAEDTLLATSEQFPLANLLLYVCQQGLIRQTGCELSLRFSGYLAKQGMRIIITFAPRSDQPSGEWPELDACDLGSVKDYAQQINASCHSGLTSHGELIYTLELHSQ